MKESRESVGNPKRRVNASKPPKRICSYIATMSSVSDSKPTTFEEEIDHQVWCDAMVEEYSSIVKNDVWEVVPRLERKSVVTSRWIYKIKYVFNATIEKYKAWFVARGFS